VRVEPTWLSVGELPTAHEPGWLAWLKTASRQLPNDLIELMDQEGCILGGDFGLQQSDGNRFFSSGHAGTGVPNLMDLKDQL
jgi:hypothetical protein